MNWRSLDWVTKTKAIATTLGRKALPTTFCGLLAVVAAQSVPACSSSTPATATTSLGSPAPSSTTATPTTDNCDHPSPGCACSDEGQTAPCGKVILREGSFFQCSEGTTTCNGSTWGTCDGDIKVNGHTISGGGVTLQGLGHSMSCGATNPCDPYCYVQIDTAPGVDAGTGLTTNDAGLSISLPTNLNTCNEPTTPATLISSLGASFQGNPASCTGGASDNCNSDNACSAMTGGTCAPYADGTYNTAGACLDLPDFTAGVGCWDQSSPAGLELQVCNRGEVTAGTGSLVVAIESATPTFAAGTCPAGSKVPTGPVLPGTGTTSGKCTIPLGNIPIGAGECLSFNVANPPSMITCVASGGGTIAATAGSQLFAVVNPPATIVAGYTPIQECDSCNNYTAINTTNVPSGSPAVGAGACVSSWCGVVANSSGTTGCSPTSPTEITGQVMDPGQNVGLSNVAVYIATAAPIVPLPAEPGGTTPPTCDTCASLSTAGYAAGVATDVNGNFTLYTSPGTYTVIAQLGRWRRIVQNVSAQACQNTVIPIDTIRMPKNQAEGDIPRMAIVEGQRESTACWLAKVGISDSEFNTYAAGNTNRIDLYNSVNGGVGGNYWNGSAAITPPAATQLWDSGSVATNTINNYSSVLLPCDGNANSTTTAAALTAMNAYANAGGRVFIDHLPGQTWIQSSTTWNGSAVATWPGSDNSGGGAGTVLNVSSDEQAMHAWLAKWDTTDTAGQLTSSTPYGLVSAVGADSTELVSFPALGAVASFWFDTPIPNPTPPAQYCGRVVFNDMHVASTRAATLSGGGSQATTFPATCATSALTAEELGLEYEMFQLSACNLGSAMPLPPPPPPPPPPPLMPTTFTRVFQGNCGPGFQVKWGFFEWKASVPTGTSITFTAQTAPDGTGGNPGTFGAVVPVATAITSSTTVFATGTNSVDTDLTTAMPAQTSQDFLEVHMTLNPTATVSPDLITWQQLYDCVP